MNQMRNFKFEGNSTRRCHLFVSRSLRLMIQLHSGRTQQIQYHLFTESVLALNDTHTVFIYNHQPGKFNYNFTCISHFAHACHMLHYLLHVAFITVIFA
jgi:hypothetical protein